MKKNLLFVIPSLCAGGGEKSLVNLLNQIDYNLYNVDIFLFNPSGVFINSLPNKVNILGLSKNHEIFTSDLRESLKQFIKKGDLVLAYSRCMFTLKNRIIKDSSKAEQYTWKYISRSIDKLEKEYDVVIGYLEKSSIYFTVDKVKSKTKIGWIHTNYDNSGMDYKYDNPYFEKLDNIVTVSEECQKSLVKNFPKLKTKISVIYNIVSPTLIHQLSNKSIDEKFMNEEKVINIITVARLSHEKGLDLAVDACKLLLEKGNEIRWYVLGDGDQREVLEKKIKDHDLIDKFKLLGIKENPYPYIKNADIYVQPSRYEGKSIAIDEAKILQKPIIVTNYETAKDQIDNKKNGVIVEMTSNGISNGISSIIENSEFKSKLISNLSKEKLGTEEQIYKLYKLFD